MVHTHLEIWCAALATVLAGTAMVTDLRWRRIPNSLTFPALITAVVLRVAVQGWAGLGLALGGAVLAPTLLLMMHRGRGLGMGDVKLVMAVGAILGPLLAAAAMLATALAGGVLALGVLTVKGRGLAPVVHVLTIGVPLTGRLRRATDKDDDAPAPRLTMPYGIAIGVGTLFTLAMCWWTGQRTWFL